MTGHGPRLGAARARRKPRRGAIGGTARRHVRGFTLIEVLVALTITAVALGAGLRAAGVLIDNAARLAEVSAAQWCADNQLTALRLAHQMPGIGDADFACDQLGRSFRGTLRTRAVPFQPNFRRVDAIVSSDAGVQLVTLTAILGRY